MRFIVDYGLVFEHPAGTGSTLRLVGWTFDQARRREDPSGATRFVLRHRGESVAEFGCNTVRPDVLQFHPQAPLDCGFDALLSVPFLGEESYPVEIEALEGHSRRPLGRFTVTSAEAVFDRHLDPAPLNPLQKSKLRNLFRNEQERVHYVKHLSAKPIYLVIDPSFSCQLRCPSCHSDMLREQGFSMRNLQPHVMQELMDAYGETVIQVYFANWGEPLLHKQFEDLVAVMKRYGIWVTTSTNLSLPFSEARAEALVRSGIDHMILSIDGATQENYEQYRRKGNLALVLDNVRKIVAAKRRLKSATPWLRWQFLIFPWNRHEIEEGRRLSEELGCDEFDAHDGAIHGRITISQEPRPAAKAAMAAGHGERLLQFRQQLQAQNKYFGCDHLYHQLSINSDGSVHPCCYAVSPEHFIGRVGQEPIGDLFNQEVLQDSRGLLGSVEAIQEGSGYEPCLHCPVLTGSGGYVESALNFFHAFQLVTGKPLRAFLPD